MKWVDGGLFFLSRPSYFSYFVFEIINYRIDELINIINYRTNIKFLSIRSLGLTIYATRCECYPFHQNLTESTHFFWGGGGTAKPGAEITDFGGTQTC